MKILVAGGTGFIGSQVVKELSQNPANEVFVLTRNAQQTPFGEGGKMVAGDVRDAPSLARATAGVEAIIHAVQFPNHPVEAPRKGYTYMEIDGRGTERMVAAAQENGVRRFIYLSGAGAGQGRPENWFRAKDVAERAVRESGMEYVILRPSWIYGPADRSLNRFIAFIKYLPFVPVIGDGKTRVQPISVFDVARIAADAVRNPAATNQTFELGTREPLTMDEILRTVMRVMGKRRPLLHQPKGLVKALVAPLQLLPAPPMSPAAIDFITTEALIDPSETERVFNIKIEPLEDGLRRYLKG